MGRHHGETVNHSRTEEHWLPVLGYEGLYEVSDLGRIRSVNRIVQTRLGKRLYKGKILKITSGSAGHLKVILSQRGIQRNFTVHKLVLEAFVGPRPEGMECCHNNGSPTDNRLINLRWDTRSNNAYDAVRHGVHGKAKNTHCPSGHEFTPENTKIYNFRSGHRPRICRKCESINKRKYRKRVSVAKKKTIT
jgi:hypothetical protein